MSQTPDPTPEEIAAACEAIRAGWTETQRRQRLVTPEAPVSVATASVDTRDL